MVSAARSPDKSGRRWIEVEGRDLSHALDHDGTPHTAGKTWLIPLDAIRAGEVEGELGRGDRVLVHIRDVKRPVAVCDTEAFLDALSARQCVICERPCAWRYCDECAGMIGTWEPGP